MRPFALLFPVIFTIFIWWFTTGLIMLVYGRARWLIRVWFVGITVAAVAAMGGLWVTRMESSVWDVYIAITCGIIFWGWQVASYYLDFITGPQAAIDRLQTISPLPTDELKRFWLALHSGIYHEIVALGMAIALAAATWNIPNKWALWTYLVLWGMHSSAKVNVFFGVRNFYIGFLPRHLHHLNRLVVRRSHNLFFPFSVTIGTSMILVLIYPAITPPADPIRLSGTFAVATLMGLGVLEHWLLLLPIPKMLWGWGSRTLPDVAQTQTAPVPVTTQNPQIKG